MKATLIATCVGQPRRLEWRGKEILTAIVKQPVEGPLRLARHNLQGDGQADLRVHGGEVKAVYAYPAEHYELWSAELPELELPWGAFGENFTTRGLHEEDVHLGDRFQVGSAEVQVTEPRRPCLKLNARFQRNDMIRRFQKSGRTGFYLRVLREGVVRAGDAFERLGREVGSVSVAAAARREDG